jgi:hypothetical protein
VRGGERDEQRSGGREGEHGAAAGGRGDQTAERAHRLGAEDARPDAAPARRRRAGHGAALRRALGEQAYAESVGEGGGLELGDAVGRALAIRD